MTYLLSNQTQTRNNWQGDRLISNVFLWQPCMNKYLSTSMHSTLFALDLRPAVLIAFIPKIEKVQILNPWPRVAYTYICRNNELNLVIKCFTPQPYLVHLFRLHPNRFLLVLSPPSPFQHFHWPPGLPHVLRLLTRSPRSSCPWFLYATLIRQRGCKWANPTRICNCHYVHFHRHFDPLHQSGSCRCSCISSRR